MDFCNKMDFLMKLTQMKNKELAAEMSVDRSLISLLRTGKRGMPQNEHHIKHMAESFAKRITTDYQRQAIAEISGLQSFRTEFTTELLALELERWLIGSIDLVEHILEGIEQDNFPYKGTVPPPRPMPAGDTLFFYGDSGKRDALRYIIDIIDNAIIGLFDNTDMSWIYSDPSLAAEIQALVKTRLHKIDTFSQVLPPLSNISCYTDSLRFLLPIYTRGNAHVYYNPRRINMSQNITMVVVPGQCVLYSYGTNSTNDNMITIVSTNKDFVNANAEQFRSYIAVCKSALTVHKDKQEFAQVISDFLALRGDVCQKTLPLSTSSMPVELAKLLAEQCQTPIWKDAFQLFADYIPQLEQHFADYTHIDICPLHSVKDIQAGKVPIACPYKPYDGHPYYTPETYILHLKNILRLMDTYKGYSFIPIAPESYQGYNLLVNDSGTALLSHGQTHAPMIMEFHRPEVVMACKEHLMRIVDREGGTEGSRKRVKAELTALISELQKISKTKS